MQSPIVVVLLGRKLLHTTPRSHDLHVVAGPLQVLLHIPGSRHPLVVEEFSRVSDLCVLKGPCIALDAVEVIYEVHGGRGAGRNRVAVCCC